MSRLLRALAIPLFIALLAGFVQTSSAQQGSGLPPHTELRPPQPTESPGKVEVIEFFWYGCPHCYAFDPFLNAWVAKLPSNVVFKRVPAIFNEQWGVAARVFYALEAINEEQRVHTALFDAIHKEGLRITDESAMAGWLAKQKVDVEKYKGAYRSFTVETKLKRALQMTQAYRIDGVPSLAVQGRYVLSASQIDERQGLVNATDTMVRTVMKQMGLGDAKPAAKSAPAKSGAAK